MATATPQQPPATDNERLKTAVEVWKHVVSVQMHFNDIEMKIRNLYFTILAAAIGLIGVTQGKLFQPYPNVKISLTMLVFLGVIPISMLFYFLDRHWYHRLLQGAVAQGIEIEKKYETELPEIQLGSKVATESPVQFGKYWKLLLPFVRDRRFRANGRLHSDAKIEVLYKSAIWTSVVVLVVFGAFGGIQVERCALWQSVFTSCGHTPAKGQPIN